MSRRKFSYDSGWSYWPRQVTIMTLIKASGRLFCSILLVLPSLSQNPRTYKIDNETRFKTVLKDVIEIEEVRNLQSPDFPQDFEVEVKNVSQKPIYHIWVAAILPQSGKYFGQSFMFNLSFGNEKLSPSDHSGLTDIPLKPGETAVLKVPDVSATHLRKYFEERMGIDVAEAILSGVVISFQIISFGDGTGYIATHEYPIKKRL